MIERRKKRGKVKRDCQVNIKLSDKEKARLEYLADEANMHKNSFVAMLVNNWANETAYE